MAYQKIVRNGVRGTALAQRLVSSVSIAKHVLEATIEIVGDLRDIIYRKGRYAEFWMVRSSRFTSRYYVVVWNDTLQEYECSCPMKCKIHAHNRAVSEYMQRERMAKEALDYNKIGDPRVA